MTSLIHPTKEQVRAYMHLRGQARLPPPAPDEIRRQLGWSARDHAAALGFPLGRHGLILMESMLQLTALLTVEWLCVAAGVSIAAPAEPPPGSGF